jgi:Zn-dependent M28 family amino/carboxypeptidase
VLLASHVDTKAVPGAEYVGANDSGSSTAVLLQQLAYLQKTAVAGGNPEHCAIAGVFFDGEEAVLPNWSDGETVHPAHIRDNTYGSRHAAGRLTRCAAGGHEGTCLPADLGGAPVVAMILMDMIGSPDLKISRDANSSPALVDLAAAGAAALGAPGAYDALPHGIEDDHMPYKVQGVPVLDLIDFNHLAYWHRPGDEPATISKESLELGARLGLYVAAAVAQNPALAR